MSGRQTPPRPSWRPTLIGKRYAIACGHYLPAMAAARILERGGNAVDAGVAASMALAVVQPDIVSFAGVAPTLVYSAGSRAVQSIAGLGYWPKAATADLMRAAGEGVVPQGILRTVLPAAPATHIETLRRFGTMTFEETAQAAYELANDGFAVYPNLARNIEKYQEKYRRWQSSVDLYLPDNRTPAVGEIFRQRELASSIAAMMQAERNAAGDRDAKLRAAHDCYYKGSIARTIVDYHAANGGLLTAEDMAGFEAPVEASISARYQDYEVHSCDVWCQGIALLQSLRTIEGYDLRALGHNSARYIHFITEALNLAFADREGYIGDPKFRKVPTAGLLSDAYAAAQRARIQADRAFGKLPLPGTPPGTETPPYIAQLDRYPVKEREPAPDTIYCCVVDGDGNAYSATLSDNARDTPVIPGYGGTVSSRGSQGRLEPGHPAEVMPGKRPRLTPAPAIALRDGEFFMGFGTPGGDVQCQAMLQVFLNVTQFGMAMQQAIEEPRFGTFLFPNSFAPHGIGHFNVEKRVAETVISELKSLGHPVEMWSALTPAAGAVCAVMRDPHTGWKHAGADPRREAYAVAW
jgi:gamma-glutamyltranspeptidase/glutathione hydrolase